MSDASDIVLQTLGNFVKSIEIDTNLTKEPMIIKDPFKVDTSKPQEPSATMNLVQPSITFRFEGGGSYTVAPSGKPSRKEEVGAYKTAAMVAGGLAAGLGLLLLISRKK